MVRVIVVLIVALLMGRPGAQGQTLGSLPVWPTTDSGTYMITTVNTGGLFTTYRIRTPFTNINDTFALPQLAGHAGVVMANARGQAYSQPFDTLLRNKLRPLSAGVLTTDGSGLVRSKPFDSIYQAKWGPVISVTDFGAMPGDMSVVAQYQIDSLNSFMRVNGSLQVLSPSDFANPPAVSAYALFTVPGNPYSDFTAQIQSNGIGSFNMTPLYGGIGYVSRMDFVWTYNPYTFVSTLWALLVKPTSSVTDYNILFNAVLLR